MTAECAETPLPKELGIEEGMRVAVLHAPDGFDSVLGALPPGVDVQHGLRRSDRVDLILGFVTERAHLERNIDWLLSTLPPAGAFWVAWPKAESGIASDLTSEVLREVVGSRGWVDVEVCAIDQTWTALKIVLRKEVRPT